MTSYDYIVVGAGSAGAVVAARLSESPDTSVLLIEAGGTQKHMNVKVPAAFSKQFKSKLDWAYYSEPEAHLGGRRIFMPRGKMLGGSSGMNAMIYIRGNRADYDGWAKQGATGWSYDEVLPLFRKSEHNSRGADEFHGADGPLYISDLRSPNEMSQKLVEAIAATGIARNDDFNGAEQLGTGLYQVSQRHGSRWTTADGYVDPARKRPNFTVMTDTVVRRVRIENGAAVGVEVEHKGAAQFLRADKEVILSAGAINTPQLLMLSGVGPADHLAEHGITTLVDNPNVGDHYMDHPMFMFNVKTTARGTLHEAQNPKWLAKYLIGKSGLLTSNIGEVGAFFHTRAGDDAPYMQFIGAPGYFFDHGFRTYATPALALGASMVGAQSKGHVRLRSGDAKQGVAITANYLKEQDDMDAMVTAVERIREVFASAPLRGLVGNEIHPGADMTSRAALEKVIRREIEHTYHPACTARIGTESEGVVDPELRVHGVQGLRVADASVFPSIPHGNTHAPTVLVGEKAAVMIAASR
ncbi:MAG TPA: FAD-dependent oxidoreductase [Jatrophihabitantaceae bacterium]